MTPKHSTMSTRITRLSAKNISEVASTKPDQKPAFSSPHISRPRAKAINTLRVPNSAGTKRAAASPTPNTAKLMAVSQ